MKRLLIVEDEPGIREALSLILSETYHVVEASDGEAALRVLEREPIDLVVLDMLMPLLDGEGVMREMAQRNLTMPVIIVSAHRALQDRAEHLGAAASLTKPFDVAQLEATIARLLERDEEGGGGSNGGLPGAGPWLAAPQCRATLQATLRL